MNRVSKFFRLYGWSGLAFNFLIAFLATIAFNYFDLDGKSSIYLIVVLVFPIVVGNAIFFYFLKKRSRNLNETL
ncbi:MAG TPA: hypothetical protein VEY10_03755 [Flavisolibacter sp.]|jgi:MFS-type transporter involved in bile tolerance (Atg22 family)|nr:hypothetical protein [Flavisolibacter sp.]